MLGRLTSSFSLTPPVPLSLLGKPTPLTQMLPKNSSVPSSFHQVSVGNLIHIHLPQSPAHPFFSVEPVTLLLHQEAFAMASTTLSTLSSLNHILPFLQGPAQCQRWHISLSVSGQPQQFSPFSELFQVLNLIPYRLVLHCSFKCSCGSLHQLDLVLCFRSLTVAVQLPQLCCHTHPFQFASLPVVFFFCLF